MFRRTKLKLVSLYTIVFFFILCIFGLSLYGYMYRSTYISIDQHLYEKAKVITKHSGKEIPEENEHETERLVAYLFWGENKKLLKSYPTNDFSKKDQSIIYTYDHSEKPQTVKIQSLNYRILTIQPRGDTLNNQSIKFIQLLYNIDPEVNLLRNMLIMIGIGSAVGLVLSCLAGLFLATKALVPIQRSWENQSRFVADASHELRTPLAVIQTHLELLFRHPSKTIEAESETIFKSLSEVKRVNKLVEELLTLARSDSNEQQIRANFFMMDDLLQLIVEQFKPIADMKEILLTETIEKNLYYYGDKERMHQLFVILLDNALKFTPAKGVVSISCKKDGNFLKISVADTGEGIANNDLPYIFDRFYRGDKSRSRSEGGTGLGLSIAKWIVDAHHGQISVESKQKEGTAFFIKLPIKDSFK